jgi:GNAT superfamily N-acetyltransferase
VDRDVEAGRLKRVTEAGIFLRRFPRHAQESTMAIRVAARDVEIVPLTTARWPDFERLFGPRGACGGCWCMTPRLTRREYEAAKGEKNHRAMARLVARGPPPGLLAYRDGEPIAWIAIAPRSEYRLLAGSRVLAPIDEQPVWSIVCLYLRKDVRGQGLSSRLIRAAADFARKQGAKIVEGYPQEPGKKPMPAVFAWTGIASAFRRAGFEEVARRSATRPIMRWGVRHER